MLGITGNGKEDLGWFCGVWLLSGDGGGVGMACTHDEEGGDQMDRGGGFGWAGQQWPPPEATNASHSISVAASACVVPMTVESS